MWWISRQESRYSLWGAHQHSQSQSGTHVLNFIHLFNFYVTRGWLTCVTLCVHPCVSLSWWLSCSSSREMFPLWLMEVFAQEKEPPESINWQWASRWVADHRVLDSLWIAIENLSSALYVSHSLFLCRCLSVPSVLTDAHGHSQQHHSSLRPLH